MKKRILCLLLALCLTATFMTFPASADDVLTIEGADRVCFAQDYKFSFSLPEGYTDPSAGYGFKLMGGDVTNVVEKDGIYTGTVEKAWYDLNDESFTVTVNAKDPDGNFVSSNKTVILSSEHTGEAVWNITPNRHEKVWSCCGTVVTSGSHDFINGVCTACGANNINEPSKFADVVTGAFYYDAVQWAVDEKITNGTGSNKFEPNEPCTRGQIVTFLWRAAGSPVVSRDVGFTDVKSGAFYYEAVKWAVANGITNGTGDNKFSPDAVCTRGETVTFLYRANKSPEVSASSSFSDVAVGAFYHDAVIWANGKNITNGTGGGKFAPDDTCTRGQVVTFLYRAQQAK